MNAELLEAPSAYLNAIEQTGASMPSLDRNFSMDAQEKIDVLIGVDETRGLLEPDLLEKDWMDWEPKILMSFLMRHFTSCY